VTLEAEPRWMRGLNRSKTLEDPDLTDWTLPQPRGSASTGKPESAKRVEAQQLHWESVGRTIPPPKGRCASIPRPLHSPRRSADASSYEVAPGACPLDGNPAILGRNCDQGASMPQSGSLQGPC